MNYSARERFEQLMRAQGQGMAAPAQGTRSSQMLSAVRMARGGEVGGLPTLEEMSDPNFQFQGTQLGASAPFTQMNPIVPMFNLEAPAFGGMEQSTYDFTAPVVQGGSMYQPPRQAPAMTESTSAYRPVDATTVMDSSGNIPNVPVNPSDYLSPMASAMGGAPATTIGSAIPQLITPEERERRAAFDRAEQDRIEQEAAQARESQGIQAELDRRNALEQQRRDEEAQRLEQEQRARNIEAKTIADARADKDAQIKQREAAAGAEAAAAKAEQDRLAAEQAAQAERERIAAAQAADPWVQYVREMFGGMFGGSPTLAPGHRISGDSVVWQEEVGGEGSFLADRRVPLANYRASDYTSQEEQGAYGE